MNAFRWRISCGISKVRNIARIALKAPFMIRNWPYFFSSRFEHEEGLLELRNGIKFLIRPDTSDRAGISEVALLDCYSSVPKNGVVVDVGANIGAFALTASLRAEVVYAIEPEQSNYDLLVRNIALNGARNVHPYRVALSDRNGTSRITCEGMSSSLHFQDASTPTEEVFTCTLEAFLREHHIDRVDYLKMDCEGAEWDIILSTPPTALARIRHIEMEFHNIGAETHPAQLEQHLAKAGLASKYSDPNSFNGSLKASAVVPPEATEASATLASNPSA